MRVVVLGGGRVGSAMARDLAQDAGTAVTVVDASPHVARAFRDAPEITAVQADLGDPAELARAVEGFDLAIGALPGPMGFAALRTVIEAGRDVVDISFFAEDPFALDALARERGVTAVVDAGIAPGCDNLILGYLQTVLDEVERFVCYVGGLPVVRTWPFEYKAPFSPIDVIAEYTRPARYVAGGRLVTAPALSEPELLDFPGTGTLEAFNTDGLRTLIATCRVPFMIEKTMRYPGHIEKMKVLREMGLFGEEPVKVAGADVRPIDLTTRLLFPLWELRPGEEDITVMRVVVEGRKEGARLRYAYDLLDRYDRATGTISMARTTGYTCTAVARLLARGLYKRPGISPLEYVGAAPGCYEFVMRELASRGVDLQQTVEPIPAV